MPRGLTESSFLRKKFCNGELIHGYTMDPFILLSQIHQTDTDKIIAVQKKENRIKISRSRSHWERAANLVKSFLTSSVIPGEEKWNG